MVASTPTTTEVVAQALAGKRLNVASLVFRATLLVSLLTSLLILITLLVSITAGAVPTLRERGLDFITSPLSLDPSSAGVWSGILGSAGIAALVAIIAFPLGIGTAVYLEEYASRGRLTNLLRTNIRNLASVPSIVYGLLGLAIFVRLVNLIGLAGTGSGRNILAAGGTMAVLVLPIVIITTSEALRAVPQTIREAGLGVGATKWEVIRHQVLPSAAPGILTGAVLAIARAFGETAPLLVIGVATGFFAAAADATFIDRVTGSYTALPVVILSWSKQTDVRFADTLAPAAIVVLLVLLLTANATAIIIRNRFDRNQQ
ncbi:phosphate transport system permease protein PstC [bacterium BMS3Bbin02]|nr:phosphate transport system permease protein PstC [bacterium BMS3Bbin02]